MSEEIPNRDTWSPGLAQKTYRSSIPRDQAYYWSREWQGGEAEADEELRRGEARTFDGPEEALRWLDSPEG